MEFMEAGIVTNIRRDGGAVQINDDWYSSYGGIEIKKAKVGKGDTVSFGWIAKGPFNNIKTAIDVNDKGEDAPPRFETSTKPEAPSRAPKFGAVQLERDRCIIRQNSLTNAVNYYNGDKEGTMVNADDIIKTAKVFEAYSSGDADVEKMEKIAHDLISGATED